MQLDNNLFLTMSAEERAATELNIFLLGGQANAIGAAKIEDAAEEIRDRKSYENVRYVVRRPGPCGRYEEWDESFGPVKEGLGFEPGYIGPELGMAQILDPLYEGTNKKALIMKVGARGVSMTTNLIPGLEALHPKNAALERFYERGSWYPFEEEGADPYRPAGILTRCLLQQMEDIYNQLVAIGFKKIRFSAFCWMQGEDDRAAARLAAYPSCMFELIRRVRETAKKLTGEDYSNLPVIMGEPCESFNKPDQYEKVHAFIDMEHELEKQDPGIHVVHTCEFQMTRMEGEEIVILGSTQWHWNYKDMLAVGRIFGEACKENC